jgi:glucose/mannose transport system substrate-binding protein
MADAGLETPTTWDEFFTVAEALKAKGIVPLAHGGADGFEGPQTFEAILYSTAGADGVLGLWNGTKSWEDEEVTEALELYKRVLTYTNEDRNSLGWAPATALVIEGRAAMNIMGDWADGEFVKAGKTAADYEGVPAPGNQGMFMLVSDGFAWPLKAPNPKNAENWLRLIATKEAQEAFNIKKGSICSRTDCDYSAFDDYLKSSAADFKTSRVIPTATHGSAIVPSWQQQYYDIVKKFIGDGDVASAQAAFVQAAADAGFPQ